MESLPWQVLLIGGHSGTGKTTLAQQLTRRLGISSAQVDDFRLVLQRATLPKEQPVLHAFQSWDDVRMLSPKEVCAQLIATARVLSDALEIVVANHIATTAPLILEGDGLVPALAAKEEFAGLEVAGQVAAVFLVEPERDQVLEAMRSRERGNFQKLPVAEQRRQAEVSWLYGQWLAEEARRYSLPLLSPRPWRTLSERVLKAVGAAGAVSH